MNYTRQNMRMRNHERNIHKKNSRTESNHNPLGSKSVAHPSSRRYDTSNRREAGGIEMKLVRIWKLRDKDNEEIVLTMYPDGRVAIDMGFSEMTEDELRDALRDEELQL